MALRSSYVTFEGYAYAALRFVAGLLFLFHGLQKLFGMYGGTQVALASQAGAAGVIELVGGLLIAVGLFTTPVAFICSGEMAAAYFMAHYPQGGWPIENRGELSALYCFLFLFISMRGGGPFSVDAIIGGRRR